MWLFAVWAVINHLQIADSMHWAAEMAESLRAELEAAEAVQAGKGPWLTVTASYSHQAGSLPSAG